MNKFALILMLGISCASASNIEIESSIRQTPKTMTQIQGEYATFQASIIKEDTAAETSPLDRLRVIYIATADYYKDIASVLESDIETPQCQDTSTEITFAHVQAIRTQQIVDKSKYYVRKPNQQLTDIDALFSFISAVYATDSGLPENTQLFSVQENPSSFFWHSTPYTTEEQSGHLYISFNYGYKDHLLKLKSDTQGSFSDLLTQEMGSLISGWSNNVHSIFPNCSSDFTTRSASGLKEFIMGEISVTMEEKAIKEYYDDILFRIAKDLNTKVTHTLADHIQKSEKARKEAFDQQRAVSQEAV